MEKGSKLHDLALQTVRAHVWDETARRKENERLRKEALALNISPNQLSNYVLQNFDELRSEAENKGSGFSDTLTSKSAFDSEFEKQNPGVPQTSTAYLMALSAHAKSVRNFDWHH